MIQKDRAVSCNLLRQIDFDGSLLAARPTRALQRVHDVLQHVPLLGHIAHQGCEIRKRQRQVAEIERILRLIELLRFERRDGASGVHSHDSRQMENRVTCLGEAQAIANDYTAPAAKLGYPPMPDGWW